MTLARSTVLAVLATLLTSIPVACSSRSGSTAPTSDAGDGGASKDSGHATDGNHAPDSGHSDATTDASKPETSTTPPVEAGSDAAADVLTGTPTLTSLGVTTSPDAGADAGAVTLVPTFSPATHDYYVRCAAGANALTVSMTAASGSTSSLLQPTSSPAAPSQTLAVTVVENEAIVAVATLGSSTAQYWVRCLPHDFPQLAMNAHPEAGTPTAG